MTKGYSPSLKKEENFLKQLWQIVKPFWVSKQKWQAWCLFFLTMMTTIAAVWTGIEFNSLNKTFYDALQDFNIAGVKSSLFHFALVLFCMVLSYGYAFYFNAKLCICWRRWLSEYYLNQWLSGKKYHALEMQAESADHPDQRLSEDLNLFPELSLNIFFLLFTSFLTFISFGMILWNLSPIFSMKISRFSIFFPGYLFWLAWSFGLLGCWVTHYLGKQLSTLDYQQQQCNAQFRFALMKVRTFSECIARSNEEMAEKNQLLILLDKIAENFLMVSVLMKRLTFFTSGYGMLGYLVGILFALPLYLGRRIQLGGLMQISGAFSSLVGAFSTLMKAYHLFATWRATACRLIEFHRALGEKACGLNEDDALLASGCDLEVAPKSL